MLFFRVHLMETLREKKYEQDFNDKKEINTGDYPAYKRSSIADLRFQLRITEVPSFVNQEEINKKKEHQHMVVWNMGWTAGIGLMSRPKGP